MAWKLPLLALSAILAGPGDFTGLDLKNLAPQSFGDSRDKVGVEVRADRAEVRPGEHLVIAVAFDHAEGWHIYAGDKPVPGGMYATAIVAETPADAPLTAHGDFIQWPEGHELTFDFLEDPVHVYEDRAVAFLPVTVAADAAPGTHTITVKPGFQVCNDQTCLAPTPYPPDPGDEPEESWLDYGHAVNVEIVAPETSIDIAPTGDLFAGFDTSVFSRIYDGASPSQEVPFDLFGLSFTIDAASAGGFVLLLLVTMVGGFLLNLTPCVLPVIPLKIMGLSSASGSRAKMLALGTSMSAGVIAFWLGLGAVIASVASFSATNQLFQYPLFTIGVGVIIAVMAVGMCGLFHVQLPQFIYAINPSHDTVHGSFGFGIMTAILSTPCTAPFMGAAAAFATTIAPAKTLTIFAAIGVGMALPYQVLSTFPNLVQRMPKTGPASELIKHVMGLLMLAAAAYFTGTGLSGMLATPPEPPSRLFWWVVAAFGTAAGAWLLWRTLRITRRGGFRVSFGGLGLAIAVISVGIGIRMTDKGPIDWVYYTPERFAAAKADGDTVVMEFTAEWCLNCRALETTVLASSRIVDLFEQDGVLPMKVDLTGNNTSGNEMLKAVDRLTIPLLVVFSPDGRETFKGDFYTVDQVVTAVRQAQGTTVASRASD
jgi:thiol:disulfide interchange protein DsbD